MRTRRRWRWIISVLGLMMASPAVVGPASAATSAAPYVVAVAAGVEPIDVAESVGATVTFRYDTAMNGFAADLTDGQVRKLNRDARVVQVDADVQFRLAAVGDVPPGESPQFTSYGQDRIGLLSSATANVDGVDERVDVDVAILDSGISGHVDLNLAGGVDCVSKKGDYSDPRGHGTQVAGFVGALDNSFGAVGVAPGARVWAVRVSTKNGTVKLSSALCGLEWVRDNADTIEVANASWGGSGSDTGACGAGYQGVKADVLHIAICEVVDAGVTVVAAAGNDSVDTSGEVPAAYSEVIAVSAFVETDGLPGGFGPPASCLAGALDDHLAFFSNYGPAVDIAAPGVCVATRDTDSNYYFFNGTSFAAPHVAGAAALIYASTPGVTPQQVRDRLVAVAERSPLMSDNDGYPEPILNVAAL